MTKLITNDGLHLYATYFDQIHYMNIPWAPRLATEEEKNEYLPNKYTINVQYKESSIQLPDINSLSNLIGINKVKTVSRWDENENCYFLTNQFGTMEIDKNYNVNINLSKDREGWDRVCWLLYCAVGLPLILCRKGYLVLHGNVVIKGDKACVVLGSSGAGKSTLTSSMIHLLNWRLFSDDLVVIKVTENDCSLIKGIPLLKLTEDQLRTLYNLESGRFQSVGYDRYKVYVHEKSINPSANIVKNSIKLSDILILMPQSADTSIECINLEPVKAFASLLHNLYNPWSLTPFEYQGQSNKISKVINRNTRVYHFNFPREIKKISQICSFIDNFFTNK